MSTTSSSRSFNEKMGDWFRHILSCCDRDDDVVTDKPLALQISRPTNFRRGEITIPGLDPEQQHFIRERAKADAQKMWAHLQPLRSSPSDHFASPTSHKTPFPSYEDFTTPRPAPPEPRRTSGLGDRVRAHSRKISNSLTGMKGVGYHSVSGGGDGRYEMLAMMDLGPPTTDMHRQVLGAGAGKFRLSGGS